MTASKKTILLLAAQLIIITSMHAMHNDDKTEADRKATRAAKAKLEKPEQAEDAGFLDALGNVQEKSLLAERDADNKRADQTKALVAFSKDKKVQESLGFAKFCQLPMDIQQKIINEYYGRAVPQYILRHMRELAPIVVRRFPGLSGSFILHQVDAFIENTKSATENAHRKNRSLKDMPARIINESLILPDGRRGIRESNVHLRRSLNPMPSDIYVRGYSDRTYMISLNPEQLKKLMDSYSLGQLEFFVSLAKIPPSNNEADIQLSSPDCAIFKSLDWAMRLNLVQRYWWIDFYTPQGQKPNACTKINCLNDKALAYGAHGAHLAGDLIKTNKTLIQRGVALLVLTEILNQIFWNGQSRLKLW